MSTPEIAVPATPAPATKLCECGCGSPAPIAKHTVTKRGYKKGEPIRFIAGHAPRVQKNFHVKHGYKRLGGSPEYTAFTQARGRCNNKENPAYHDYGGRGIKFLFKDFMEFLNEVGPRPFPNYTLDRINNDGNYEAGNLRWASRITQNRNQRRYAARKWTRPEIPSKGTTVRLVWLDSTTIPGWTYVREGEEIDNTPRMQVTYGTVVSIGPLALTVAATVSPLDMNAHDLKEGLMDLLIIPLGCVTEVEVLTSKPTSAFAKTSSSAT